MLIQNVIEVRTENTIEEQLMFKLFPDATWINGSEKNGGFSIFYLPENKKKLLEKYFENLKK